MQYFKSFQIIFLFILGFVVSGLILINSMVLKKSMHDEADFIIKVEHLSDEIRYHDEVLTMSARMAALTGDMEWEARYREHEEKLDRAIQEAITIIPIGTQETEEANIKLIAKENKAFEAVRQGDLISAQTLLLSPEYDALKASYTDGLERFYREASNMMRAHHNHHDNVARAIEIVSISGVILIIMMIYLSYRSIRHAGRQEKIALEYQRMASLARFYAGIAHEVNNAMQPILGYADILRSRLSKRDDMEDEAAKLESIYERAEHIRDIVINILSHTRGVHSQQTATPAQEVFEKALELAKAGLPEDIKVETNLTAVKPETTISINQTDVGQIVKNLVINASHAMKDSGTITITADYETMNTTKAQKHNLSPGQFCTLSVIDTGHGMDKKTKRRIFDPFFTTKGEGQGNGLGLAMCYGIMQQMNGAILADSQPDKGATFTLYFPIVA